METRICTKCFTEKRLSEFSFRNKKEGVYQYWCKRCTREYGREHYRKNVERERPRRLKYQAHWVQTARGRYLDYLRTHLCVDCGETDPVVLEFDHVRGEKRAEISSLLTRVTNWDVVLAEIAKCDVVCANCHRRRTARVQGWYGVQG